MKRYLGLFACVVLNISGAVASPYYIDATVSVTEFPEADIGATDATLTQDRTDVGFGISLGYAASENTNIEISYINHGTYQNEMQLNFPPYSNGPNSKYELDISSFLLGFRSNFPASESTSIDILVGIHRWDLDGISNGVSYSEGVFQGFTTEKHTKSGTDPVYGIGATYSLTDNIALKPSLSRFEIDSDVINSLVFGISYHLR